MIMSNPCVHIILLYFSVWLLYCYACTQSRPGGYTCTASLYSTYRHHAPGDDSVQNIVPLLPLWDGVEDDGGLGKGENAISPPLGLLLITCVVCNGACTDIPPPIAPPSSVRVMAA
jgi:hypothetical protein